MAAIAGCEPVADGVQQLPSGDAVDDARCDPNGGGAVGRTDERHLHERVVADDADAEDVNAPGFASDHDVRSARV